MKNCNRTHWGGACSHSPQQHFIQMSSIISKKKLLQSHNDGYNYIAPYVNDADMIGWD